MSKGPDAFFAQQFAQAYREQASKVGRFNLVLLGKTGVGKSSLVNAVFGAEVAATGIGRPVTQQAHLYVHDSEFLGLYDTRGLEIGVDTGRLVKELSDFVQGLRRRPLEEQLHVAWYCVRATDRRFEETEAEVIRAVHRLGLPVIMVMTQVALRDGRPHPDAVALAEEIRALDLPVVQGRPFLTMAHADEFAGWEAHGLKDLLDATFRVAPAGAAEALVAAQKIDLERKKKQAETRIAAAVTAAGTAGATPIPFADAVVLVPIQLGMMASISQTYGVPLDKATLAGFAATAGATQAGRSLVGGLLKMIPGAGSVVGGTINAAVASGITFAMGHAWLRVCEMLAKGHFKGIDGALESDAMRELFSQEFARQWKRKPKKLEP